LGAGVPPPLQPSACLRYLGAEVPPPLQPPGGVDNELLCALEWGTQEILCSCIVYGRLAFAASTHSPGAAHSQSCLCTVCQWLLTSSKGARCTVHLWRGHWHVTRTKPHKKALWTRLSAHMAR
jgi:hypothetical protein